MQSEKLTLIDRVLAGLALFALAVVVRLCP